MCYKWHHLLLLISVMFAATHVDIAQQVPSASKQSRANPVTLTMTVTDKYGRYVNGLSKDQLTIFDENVAQEIVQFEQKNVPISLVLLFDVSRSMAVEPLTAARAEFLRLVESNGKSNEYSIVGFDKQISLLTDFTRDRDSIVDGLNRLARLGSPKGTSLYDALNLGMEKVRQGANHKRVILIVSDGDDNNSRSRRNDLLSMIKQTDVLIYAIGIRKQDLSFAAPATSPALDNFCSVTGGTAFYPRTTHDIKYIFEAFALELQNHYSVSFIPSGFIKEGEWRRLRFKIKPLEFKKTPSSQRVETMSLAIRGREGYYAVKTQ